MHPDSTTPWHTVAHIFAFYRTHGQADYIGEPVSQLEHMWQAAALAEAAGYEEEVVLAAFFHDFGHLCALQQTEAASMDGYGAVNHEKLGADYLRRCGFSERLARLVESHVLAKRYLTYRYPEYRQHLSPASQATLAFQGGAMTAPEAAAFEANPDAEIILQLRHWDDLAKQENLPLGDLLHLEQMALRHLLRERA